MLGGCTVCLPVGGSVDEVILALTKPQRGRVARGQLLAAGVSHGAIDWQLARQRLVTVHTGVYGLPGTDEIPLSSDAAALLAGGPGTRLSHHSAAVLWALRPGVADPVHITVPHSRRGPATAAGVIVHRTTLEHPDDVRIHRGLPVTSPARTMVDNAARLPDREVEQMLDEALFVRRLLTRAELTAILDRAGGHPGRPRLERVAGHARSGRRRRTDSPPEERLLQMVLAAGLPEPDTQTYRIGYKLDLFWPRHGLAVEVDAYGTHGSRRRFAADRQKDARLLAECGIVVLRFTDRQIEDRPLETIATLARALAKYQREP